MICDTTRREGAAWRFTSGRGHDRKSMIRSMLTTVEFYVSYYFWINVFLSKYYTMEISFSFLWVLNGGEWRSLRRIHIYIEGLHCLFISIAIPQQSCVYLQSSSGKLASVDGMRPGSCCIVGNSADDARRRRGLLVAVGISIERTATVPSDVAWGEHYSETTSHLWIWLRISGHYLHPFISLLIW